VVPRECGSLCLLRPDPEPGLAAHQAGAEVRPSIPERSLNRWTNIFLLIKRKYEVLVSGLGMLRVDQVG